MTLVTENPVQTPVLAGNGSAEFNRWLWNQLTELGKKVANQMGEDLIAVVLGGGYGRGQGCVAVRDANEFAYNDVDLFLVTARPHPRGNENLHVLREEYEQILRIDVDFSRPQTPRMIREWPPLLMWHELALGHQVLYGPADVISSNVPSQVFGPPPKIEASRLLLNRGAGLVWAGRVMDGFEAEPDPTFVARNFFKCTQAVADAVLIAYGRYSTAEKVKAARLFELQKSEEIVAQIDACGQFEKACEFRRSPYVSHLVSRHHLEKLAHDWLLIFLWVESQRTCKRFDDVRQYLGWTGEREAGEIGLLQRLGASLRRKRLGLWHPREHVYRALPVAVDDLCAGRNRFKESSAEALRRWREAQ